MLPHELLMSWLCTHHFSSPPGYEAPHGTSPWGPVLSLFVMVMMKLCFGRVAQMARDYEALCPKQYIHTGWEGRTKLFIMERRREERTCPKVQSIFVLFAKSRFPFDCSYMNEPPPVIIAQLDTWYCGVCDCGVYTNAPQWSGALPHLLQYTVRAGSPK